ncbi:MAG: hypothetical protein J5J06_09135 [Phycisphaerae bacterium]|nr:hypothetical protein [Phycisphaerae bacterium]
MLDRIHVVRGGEYQVDGETWWVHVIHRLGSGESVTLCDCSLVEYDRRLGRSPVERSRLKYMPMRRFLRAATVVRI